MASSFFIGETVKPSHFIDCPGREGSIQLSKTEIGSILPALLSLHFVLLIHAKCKVVCSDHLKNGVISHKAAQCPLKARSYSSY